MYIRDRWRIYRTIISIHAIFITNPLSCQLSGIQICFSDDAVWIYVSVYGCRMNDINIGSKENEVTGKWRKLHNHEFCNFYTFVNIVRVTELIKV
jgi:hypothetical protein